MAPVDSKVAGLLPPDPGSGVRVAQPDSPREGQYFDRLLERLGLADAMADGVITAEEAREVGIALSVLVGQAAKSRDVEVLGDELRVGDLPPVRDQVGQLALRRLARVRQLGLRERQLQVREQHLDLQAEGAHVAHAEGGRQGHELEHVGSPVRGAARPGSIRHPCAQRRVSSPSSPTRRSA